MRLPYFKHFLRLRVHKDGSRIDGYCIGVVDPYAAQKAIDEGKEWGSTLYSKPVLVMIVVVVSVVVVVVVMVMMKSTIMIILNNDTGSDNNCHNNGNASPIIASFPYAG